MLIKTKKRNPTQAVRYSLLLSSMLLLLSAATGASVMAIDIKPPITAHVAAADQAKTNDRVYSMKEVSPPKLLWAPDPVYPKRAHDAKGPFQGVCVVKLIVDSSGKPNDIQIVRSLGPDFDENTLNAVRQYRFSPATRNDVPVAVVVHIEVNFKKY